MNMREKIARAIAEAIEDRFPGRTKQTWDQLSAPAKDAMLERSDAVLHTLMEPSEEMISAADEAMRHKVVTGSARIETLKVGFLAMIQAAKEGK